MKNLIKILIILLISYFITGCSNKTLTVRTLYPSDIEKEKVNSIKIERLQNDDINQTKNIADRIANKFIDNQRVFTLKNDIFGTDAILNGEVINSSLNISNYHREEIDYSRCRFYAYDERNRRNDCIRYEIRFIPCERRDYNVSTNIRLIKPIENRIIFSKRYDRSNYENICFDHPYYGYNQRPPVDARVVNSQLASDIANEIINDISPHYVYFNVAIIEELDDNPMYTKDQKNRFEYIVKLMIAKNLDLAKTQLEVLGQELGFRSFEVNYNLALIYEAYGELARANNLYTQTRLLTQNMDYLKLVNDGINRTSVNIEEKIKAKSQLPIK